MSNDKTALEELQRQAYTRQKIQDTIVEQFAAEDEGLRNALSAAKAAGLPEIQISPVQGKLLQVLATACNAHKILEIGSLGGYSGIWLARALPPEGRLITLEINPTHAEAVRSAFASAGVSERTEVRVGRALDLLPQLESEAPFDLFFIDADKPPYPEYLEWALRLARPGSIIVADNCVSDGNALHPSQDAYLSGLYKYNQRIASHPRLVSLLLPMDEDYMDGFAVSVVKF